MKIGRSISSAIAAHRIEADAHALSVITIDANKDWQGKSITNFKTLELISGGYLHLEDTLDTNLEWSGIVIRGTAGEDLAQFETVYRKSDGKYWKAKADNVATMPVMALSAEAISADAVGFFLLKGWLRLDGMGLSVGACLYQSDVTAGSVTETIPDTSGDQVQIVGCAITAVIIYFDPNLVVLEVT